VSPAIRPARLTDAAAIAHLSIQLGYDLSEIAATDRLSRILQRENQALFVADANGCAVGWVHLVFNEPVDVEPFVMISGLVVDRDRRRQGIGRSLLQRAESWAREQGCAMLRLSSSVARTEAHRFYEELGYTRIKTQYSFVKPLDASAATRLHAFVPEVSEER